MQLGVMEMKTGIKKDVKYHQHSNSNAYLQRYVRSLYTSQLNAPQS